MNPLTTINNQISTYAIQGNKRTHKSVVCIAECTKHKLIYTEQTGD